jgi:hypothetical protein
MPKTVSIAWCKQKSGWYALKGITIHEGDQAYDSMSRFRDEDAKWLTEALGAEASIESLDNRLGLGLGVRERIPQDYPEWAHNAPQEPNSHSSVLGRERAGATLLRHALNEIIEAYGPNSSNPLQRKLVSEANAALLGTDAGTYYTPGEAHTTLGGGSQKSGRAQVRQ